MKHFVSVALLFIASLALAQKPQIRFLGQSLGTEGIQVRVSSIVEDQLGFMWVGTESGLHRFDGYTYTPFRHEEGNPESIPAGHVAKLWVDRAGRLWLGMAGGGLCRYFESTQTFQAYALGPIEEPGYTYVEAIAEDKQGYLWVGTRAGLVRFSPDQPDDLKHYSFGVTDLGEPWVRSLFFDRDGVLWIGFGNALYRLAQGQQRPERITLDGVELVKNIEEDNLGRLWLCTERGLVGLEKSPLKVAFVFNERTHPGFPDAVSDVCQDSAGRIWASTYLKGLILIEDPTNQRFYSYTEQADDPWGLGTRSIWDIYRDRHDNIWFATNQGLRWLPAINTRTNLYSRSPVNQEPSLNDSVVWCFFQDRAGTIWVGTDRGLSRWQEDAGRFDAFLPEPSHPEDYSLNRVRAIHQDRAGIYWVATREKVVRFSPERGFIDEVLADDSSQVDRVRAIIEDRKGRKWLGSFHDGMLIYDPGQDRIIPYRAHKSEPPVVFPQVRCLLEDTDGHLWVGSEKGLGKFDPDRDTGTMLGSSQGRDMVVMTLLEDRRGFIWAGTNIGLKRMTRQGEPNMRDAVSYGPAQGLDAFILYGILQDANDKFWISTENGLVYYDPVKQRSLVYHAYNGLQSEDYSSGAYMEDSSGRMFFGGQEGFNVFNPKLLGKDLEVPPVVLTQLYLGHKAVDPNSKILRGLPLHRLDKLAVDQQDKVISFDFAALDYSFPAKNQYAYKLEGFDADWVIAPPQIRKATYTNLDPGSYLFRIKAANSLGSWNEEGAKLRINVAALPWLTWQAKLAYLLCAISLGSLVLYLRARKLTRERLHWQALDAKNKEIIRAQSQLVMQEKMASVGLLTAGIAHEIKNPTTFTRLSAQNLGADLEEFRNWLLEMAGEEEARAFKPVLEERMKPLFEHLELIREGSGRIVALAQNLQTFSRADNAQQTVDLTEGIVSTLNLVRSKFKDYVSFEMNFADPLSTLCRPGQLNQVFMNLIVNACQEMRQCYEQTRIKGKLTIETERLGDEGIIRFQDTGGGIPREMLDQIFEPFFTTKPNSEGTGLGLAISARIIREHKGRIEVSSTPGQGTTFTLYLPSGRGELKEDPKPTIAATQTSVTGKI